MTKLTSLLRRVGRKRPGREELIARKHQLEGEIRMLNAELRRRQQSGRPTGDVQRRLEQTRSRHFRTRLDIDRSQFDKSGDDQA